MSAPDIRPLAVGDEPAVATLIAEAFAASELGHTGEADLVRELREDGDVVLELVATEGSVLVGHILFSRMTVTIDGTPIEAVGLAPLAVRTDRQKSGIGSALTQAAHDILRARGIPLAFVHGHPDYYPRFGYSADFAKPFVSECSGEAFMACALTQPIAVPAIGVAKFAPAFDRIGH